MGHITEGGNYVDPEGGLYIPGAVPSTKGIQTGEIKTAMTQSKAGLGTQGPVMTKTRSKPIPAPTHPDMPDA